MTPIILKSPLSNRYYLATRYTVHDTHITAHTKYDCTEAIKMILDEKNSVILALEERLQRIATIIERVDNRCLATDGPVSRTCDEMTDDEMREIYRLAVGGDHR